MTSSVTSTSSTSSTSSSSLTSDSASDLETTFLTLLVTQLQNQDPTNPEDSTQMTSELAQISTVSGINSLETSLDSLATQLNTSQQLQAGSLVGSGVLSDGNTITVATGTDSSGDSEQVVTPIGIQLPSAATSVTVTISDSNGNVVQTLNLGAEPEGVTPIEWNGENSSGTAVANGSYTFTVTATGSSGTITATPLAYSTIEAVGANSDGTTNLQLSNGTSATLSQIAELI
ncbi:FlgD immunoglobulin-like domain containing protein [Pararobbsia silviterrae]|uniref:FlgD immunoglobulin-like domain containing protein n=1 Tax=Pararobbsia silviterrae TaxID=1792498 RepID=UPI00197E8F76|nr:FlgD immunoglobulin-like domain containing protein [Pararobbsia silviterrae]